MGTGGRCDSLQPYNTIASEQCVEAMQLGGRVWFVELGHASVSGPQRGEGEAVTKQGRGRGRGKTTDILWGG